MKKKVIVVLIVVLVLGTIAAFLAGNERLGVLGTVISGILSFGAAGGSRIKAAGDRAFKRESARIEGMTDAEIEAEIPDAAKAREERNKQADEMAREIGERAAAKRAKELGEQSDEEVVKGSPAEVGERDRQDPEAEQVEVARRPVAASLIVGAVIVGILLGILADAFLPSPQDMLAVICGAVGR